MNYEDRTTTCQGCGLPFSFRADDQSHHALKGFTKEPRTYDSLRQTRRTEQDGENGHRPKDMYPWYAPKIV